MDNDALHDPPLELGGARGDGGVGALARALLAGDGDSREVSVRWLAGRLSASVVLFRQDRDGVLFPRAVACADPDADQVLRERSRSLQRCGQAPDVDLPDVGRLRGLSSIEVDGSFLATWHQPGGVPMGMVARVDADALLWVGRRDALVATDVALVADALPWLQLVLRQARVRRAAELEAERALAQLAGHQDGIAVARESLDRVALAYGHELRETIRRLQGSLRLATAPDVGPAFHDEFVHRAATTVDQLAAQVGDLLEELDAEAAGRLDARELVDLNGIAAWVRDTLAGRVEDRRARLVTRRLPTVKASPSDLRRILLELVDNALEHGGRFVEVVVDAHALPGGALELTVSDNGPGVPSDLRTTVFDPGFQTAGGAGFGLTRLRLLVESLGGTVDLAPSDQGGCRATVVLPAVLGGMHHAPQVDGAGSV